MRLIGMRRPFAALAVTLLLVSACGVRTELAGGGDETLPPSPVAGMPSPTVTRTGGPDFGAEMDGPPPFTLRYDEQELVLNPHTWCYASGCVDGISEDPPSVGSPESVLVHVPVERFELLATFQSANDPCGRYQQVEPAERSGWHELRPVGRAGEYVVQLFPHGTGDMVADFTWQTPVDGPLPKPEARLALIADHDGEPDSYGIELALSNLAETPRRAGATIEVTAANGRSLSFDATRAKDGCHPEGSVYFDGPDAQGKQAASLGDMPFHYEVTLQLDGATYHASADYPADEIEGNEPSVALTFTPSLPRME